MIIFYAVWMGIDADLNTELLITDAQAVCQTADQLFCVYFVVEFCIRYFAFEKCWDRLRDPWFVLDSFLVPLTVFDTWAMTVISLTSNVQHDAAAFVRRSEIIRLFRILRLTRLGRVVKLVRFFPELQILIKAIVTAFRAVFFCPPPAVSVALHPGHRISCNPAGTSGRNRDVRFCRSFDADALRSLHAPG